jgi:hypothetical protein
VRLIKSQIGINDPEIAVAKKIKRQLVNGEKKIGTIQLTVES